MQVKTFSFTKVNVMSQHSYNTCIPDLFGQSDWQVLQLYHTSWYTRRCRVQKVKKNVDCTWTPSSLVVIRCHPLSPAVPCHHLLSPVTTLCHLFSPVVTRYYPFSPVVTCSHPSSPVTSLCHLSSTVVTCHHPLQSASH